MTKGTLIVQDTVVAFTRVEQGDFISLTDLARVKNPAEPKDVVKNWLRTRATVEFLGLWEKINNSDFKGVEFDAFKVKAESNALDQIAIYQMRSLLDAPSLKKLK
jgi:KilA-N domain